MISKIMLCRFVIRRKGGVLMPCTIYRKKLIDLYHNGVNKEVLDYEMLTD